MLLHVLCLAAASELNLNELAQTLQESLLKATDTDVSAPGYASSEQLQRVTDLLLSLMPQPQSPALEFDPPLLLDFGELAVAVPVSRQLSLVNRSNAVIKISSIVLFDEKQFELSLAQGEIHLSPQESFMLHVAFFPSTIGLASNLLLLNTSVGRIQYFIRAETTFNPYKLEPIFYDSLLSDSSFSHRLFIYNPHREPMEIRSVATTNEHLKTNFTDEDYSSWQVQPGKLQQFAILHLTTRAAGNYMGKIIIDTSLGNLFVPVSLFIVKAALRFEPSFIKLGVLTNRNASFNFELFVTNLGKKGIAVHEIKPVRSSDRVKVKQTGSLVNYKARASLGTVSVYPSRNGVVSGSVLVYTNETSEPMEVRYRGEVNTEVLEYNRALLSFYPGNEHPRTVEILNPKNNPLLIFNISTSSPEIILSSSISHSIGPHETCHFNVSYTGSLETPKTHYISLHSSFDEILLPVVVHNDQLECYINNQPCTDTIDLGSVIFEGEKVYSTPVVMELVNSSLLDKKIKKINAPQGIKVKANDAEISSPLTIKQGESILIEVTYDVASVLNKRSPVLSIVTDRNSLRFDIIYTPIKGSLKYDPLAFVLKSPSQTHSLNLRVTNRFPVAVVIKSVSYDSKVLDVNLIKDVIKPNTTVDLAKVTFGFNELKFKRRLASLNSLTYEDLAIYKEIEELWHSISHKTFHIKFTTNHSFNLEVSASASVMRTQLTFSKKLDFGMVYVDSLRDKYIELKNNLDQPVSYKLYLSPNTINLPSIAGNCKRTTQGLDDDEFEVVSPQLRNEACNSFLQEEVLPIKAMSSMATPFPRRELKNWSLYGKIAGFIGDLLYFSQHNVYYNTNSAFYIDGDREGTIAPKQSVIVGPLNFLPQASSNHNTTLLIKSNHTFIEEVRLEGVGEYNSLQILTPYSEYQETMKFAITLKDVLSQLTTAYVKSNPLDLAFPFDIILKNSGKLPVKIKNVLINGHSCQAFGIKITECVHDYTMLPNHYLMLKLVYSPNFQQETVMSTLTVVTERGLIEKDLEIKIDEEVLKEYNFKSYKWYRWTKIELLETEVAVLIGLMIGYGTMAYLVVEDRRLSKLVTQQKAAKKVREEQVKSTVSEALSVQTDKSKEIAATEEPKEIAPITPVLKKPQEKKKNHKNKVFSHKFSVSVPSFPVSEVPFAVVTNAKAEFPGDCIPVRCDSESKDSDTSTSYKAGSTTPHSEEEGSEDYFVDTYKFKALFAGPRSEFVSLVELRDH